MLEQIAAPLEIPEEITGRYTGIELDVRRLERWKEEVTPVIYGVDAKVDTLLTIAAKSDAERERRAARDAEELAKKRTHAVTVIKAIGAALALIIAAYVGRGAL